MNFTGFNDILKFAIDREEEAISAYGRMSEIAQTPGLQQMCLELQEEERGHKRLLEDITPQRMGEIEVREVTDLKISDYLVEEPLTEEISFQDLLIFAAKKEQKAVEFYEMMRDRVEDPESRKLFSYLIEQEKTHKLRLETEYDQSVLEDD